MVTIISTEVLGGGRLANRQLGVDEMTHTIERYLKRIETSGSSFRGQTLESRQSQQINMRFPTLSEASLAAIEVQRRISDLPPVSGVRLNVRIGIHTADSEDEALGVALQLMNLALPEQILCGREVLLDQVHTIGVGMRDLQQTTLEDGTNFQVVELLWHDENVPVSLTATSVLSLADLELEPIPLGRGEEHPSRQSLPLADSAPVASPAAGLEIFTRPPADVQSKLCVRYQGKAFLLDAKTPFITMGRDRSNDLAVDDTRVSRQHARIERKEGRYYLVEMSTNGTFVLLEGATSETFLRKESLCLTGNGALSFCASISREGHAKKVEFEFL